GPTVWITHRAGRFPAVVATARPAGSPSGYWSMRMRRVSERIAGPPTRWMAASTPPPTRSSELAALTTASTRMVVMSPGSMLNFMGSMAPTLDLRDPARDPPGVLPVRGSETRGQGSFLGGDLPPADGPHETRDRQEGDDGPAGRR